MHLRHNTQPFVSRCLNSPLYLLVKLFPDETGTSRAQEAKALEMVSYNCFRKVSAFHKICLYKQLPKCASYSASPSQILIIIQNMIPADLLAWKYLTFQSGHC